jgi:hypothetical protein
VAEPPFIVQRNSLYEAASDSLTGDGESIQSAEDLAQLINNLRTNSRNESYCTVIRINYWHKGCNLSSARKKSELNFAIKGLTTRKGAAL